ncbi:glycosyltransferase family 2 protein [Gaoshiqia sediminis]|uniref:Glycosyltransferase n=1 Tax=Gaoshiqia sediminis TaxID=2986998 RepID=A0AA42CBA9_9BACT|nr:glycosyltransferase family 2 protein [Gaoshiqia sediminis]MCW0484745.1 glycosyltransferase [Gaoshiqia sediminis]
MKFSLITATYNSAATLATCIASVQDQTHPDIEHIIIDGASKDNTLEVIRSMPNRVSKIVSEPDKGIYDAMNKGIGLASGELVGILNSDDLLCDPEALAKVVRVFEADPSLDAVYADLYYVDQQDTNKIVRRWTSGEKKPFSKGWHPAHPTLYLKKSVYNAYGLFNLDLKLAADFEIMLRFLEKHRIKTHYLPERFVKMRLGGATNKSLGNIYKQNIECIKAFRVNNLPVNPVLYPFYRIVPKLFQYKDE